MSSFTNLPQLAEMMLSKPSSIKKGCYTYQWLDNIDMHLYANFWSKYTMWFKGNEHFTNWPRTDRRTVSQSDYSADPRIV